MDENQVQNTPPQGIVPSVTGLWDKTKGPIAFLAIGFLLGRFYKGKSKVVKI
jgi:hypothetical protein